MGLAASRYMWLEQQSYVRVPNRATVVQSGYAGRPDGFWEPAPLRASRPAPRAQRRYYPRSASCGMPIGATRTRPATADPRRASSPVLGRWNVTVT